ncbi:ParB/Srx family N-terminal domain-containing protein [Defluviimonas sp. WL0050]|uniref:ParB/Srx family N-terminal domain-containing protein n=1 Tax=Albidovulum litorale TaxID=2984134 RepID=A0ABT2ZU91_9RHOB|nr:ParB/Srx family N-terminal domain-containing protein [Defluviimonas sp. WL0050]MCV2874604.1 ParB/Srx family N-terminal domain-containing protein [Defluviimonas sp. WL0050]
MATRVERRAKREVTADSAAPALAVDYRPIADLIPYTRNARTHSEAQVTLIAGSIREYGFTNPVLVDGANGIIAGHGRVRAARQLGLSRVPVIELGHLSEAQKRAYILADNRLAEQAGWDREMLAIEAGELSDLGIDLVSLGFEAGEIDALLRGGEADPREDVVPEVPAVPVSRPGDLWVLGRHRLICGDATDAATVERLLGGVTPHLMVTDPGCVRRTWLAAGQGAE